MPDDRPNHPVNRALRAAAGRRRIIAMPAQSPAARTMNATIHAAARRGQITDRGEPVPEPTEAPAGPVDWGGGPRGSLPSEPEPVSSRMNRWIRGAVRGRRSLEYHPDEEDNW